MRFIGAIVILCAGIVGQSDAQQRDRNTEIYAFWKKQDALHHSLLDTFAECRDRTPKGQGVQCDIFKEQVRQTELDIFLTPELATVLKKKLSADDVEDIKSTIGLHMINAYYYGKSKQ